MAVTYKPHKSTKTLLIGGQSLTTGTDGGLVGPFPRFSIDREEIFTGDGTYLGTKFAIQITGTATLNENDPQDITVKGQRQTAVQGSALTAVQFDRDQFPTQGHGILEITPYGGGSNVIKFSDARLLSVSLPEQEEQEAGVQTVTYTFSFEAYKEASSNSSAGSTGSPQQPTWKLSSAEETWELAENEDTLFYQGNDPENDLRKTYTLTHIVSAVGLRKYASHGVLDDKGEAWRQAAEWVKTRLKESTELKNPTQQDLTGDADFWKSQFVPITIDSYDRGLAIGPDLKDGSPSYRGYNHVRQMSSDLGGGSYSVTETWLLCEDDIGATHSIEISVEDNKEAFVSVSVSATIQGLNPNSYTNTAVGNFEKAQQAFSVIKSKTYALATTAYTNSGAGGALRNIETTKSYGENKVSGTITYSVSYNDLLPELEGAITENVTINYDNEDGSNRVIAKIPIIGKIDGPIIQDMSTTTIKIVSATLDAVMDRPNRTSKPNGASVLDNYKPPSSFQQSKTESWNPRTGAYNMSISWEYN
jgi:hypothetical protein